MKQFILLAVAMVLSASLSAKSINRAALEGNYAFKGYACSTGEKTQLATQFEKTFKALKARLSLRGNKFSFDLNVTNKCVASTRSTIISSNDRTVVTKDAGLKCSKSCKPNECRSRGATDEVETRKLNLKGSTLLVSSANAADSKSICTAPKAIGMMKFVKKAK